MKWPVWRCACCFVDPLAGSHFRRISVFGVWACDLGLFWGCALGLRGQTSLEKPQFSRLTCGVHCWSACGVGMLGRVGGGCHGVPRHCGRARNFGVRFGLDSVVPLGYVLVWGGVIRDGVLLLLSSLLPSLLFSSYSFWCVCFDVGLRRRSSLGESVIVWIHRRKSFDRRVGLWGLLPWLD